MSTTTTLVGPATRWLMERRTQANRALTVLGAVALALAVAAPAVGVVRAVTAFVWFGAILLVLALPWTDWNRLETDERDWRARDAVSVRPPIG